MGNWTSVSASDTGNHVAQSVRHIIMPVESMLPAKLMLHLRRTNVLALPDVLIAMVIDYCCVTPVFDPQYLLTVPQRPETIASQGGRCVKPQYGCIYAFGKWPTSLVSTWCVQIFGNDDADLFCDDVSYGVGFGWSSLDPLYMASIATQPHRHQLSAHRPRDHTWLYVTDFCGYNHGRLDYSPWESTGDLQTKTQPGPTTNALLMDHQKKRKRHLVDSKKNFDILYFEWNRGDESVTMQVNDLFIGHVCTLTLEQAAFCRPLVQLTMGFSARFLLP